MPDPITALNHAMNNDLLQLRVTSQNLSNVNTDAYKRSVVQFNAFESLVNSVDIANQDTSNGAVNLNHKVTKDMRQGTMKYTGSAFDVAIKGDAFLQLNGDSGPLLSKSGKFRIDEQGHLVDLKGHTVAGEGGLIRLDNRPFEIDKTGVVEQGGILVDKLKLLTVDNVNQLEYIGGGLYQLAAARLTSGSDDTVVMQGYVESSNVNTMHEMVKMIETTRHFEASHQVLRGYDGMLDAAINILGEF